MSFPAGPEAWQCWPKPSRSVSMAVDGRSRAVHPGRERLGGLAAKAPVTIENAGIIATSFPQFTELMRGLGAQIEGG